MTEKEWNQGQRQHHREALGEILTPSERAMAEAFRQTLEREETIQRQPATERLETQLFRKEERNRQLLLLLERETSVLQKLRDALTAAESERQAIARERQRIDSAVV